MPDAIMGVEAQKFFSGTIGQYLRSRCLQESDKADKLLREVSPTDAAKIMELQIEAKVIVRALEWLAEAIAFGEEAEFQIKQLEEMEAIENDGR